MKELFDPKLVVKQFNCAADTYNNAAIMQKHAAQLLLERLDMIKIQPKTILDLGAGTGFICQVLVDKFPYAKIIALDVAQHMLDKIDNEKIQRCCAPAEQIPLPDNSVDLVISNMLLHWSVDINKIFQEASRVLKEEALFLYTTLGPDTLIELRSSWQQIDDYNHVHHFYDMHDLGDAMLQSDFYDPVMDMQRLTVCYKNVNNLFDDLKMQGMRNVAEPRKPGLTTKNQMEKLIQEYNKRKVDDTVPATYELIFGHGWKKQRSKSNEFRVSIDDIKFFQES